MAADRQHQAVVKQPCLYPLPDGRRCCECDNCQQTGDTDSNGGVSLSASQCALLLDFLDELKVAYEGYYESGDLAHLLNMEAKLRAF